MTLFTHLRHAIPALRSTLTPSIGTPASTSSLHTSAVLASWGGGKLKTHNGTAKRFRAMAKRKVTVSRLVEVGSSGGVMELVEQKTLGPMFKRGKSGKQHLNSKMSKSQGQRLRGTKIEESGHTTRTLQRLIGSHS